MKERDESINIVIRINNEINFALINSIINANAKIYLVKSYKKEEF